MITLLIGHRGTGKTSLLGRAVQYHREQGRECLAFDLDRLIEETEKKSIPEIFAEKGEAEFRQLEIQALHRVLSAMRGAEKDAIIAAGAGFVGPVPPGVRCLWIRRPSDAEGRIFVDPSRPRLNAELGPRQEFINRYGERHPRFHRWADEELTLSEGFTFPNPWERAFLLDSVSGPNGILTLLPETFQTEARCRAYIERRLPWQTRFELRDDLLEPEMLELAFKVIPPDRILFSLRKDPAKRSLLRGLRRGALWDWPVEWPIPLDLKPPVLSLHERAQGASITETARKLELLAPRDGRSLLKLAVEVRDFDELWEGHAWAMTKPSHRTFLPRSWDGRWVWYRLLMQKAFRLNFIREGDGSAPDQPYLLDWLRVRDGLADPAAASASTPPAFAAILGDPVRHSFTPAEQTAFFHARGLPVLAIALGESDWDHGALEVLRKLGLRAAAVTSPLKLKANQSAKTRTPEADRFQSVNTLLWDEAAKVWRGHNTDFEGLRHLLETAQVERQKTVVWGGGGTLPILEAALPHAVFYSARDGQPREGQLIPPEFAPEIVIWGVGRSRLASGPGSDQENWPDPAWSPRLVVDLNYAEDSPGREYALRIGAQYVSGLAMFSKQAEAQRRFWSANAK